MYGDPEEFLKSYESALATQNWQSVSPFFHEDACVTFNDGTYKGKAEVQGAFERTFALIQDEKYGMTDVYWVRKTGESAVCLYTFHWSGLIDGKRASGSGRGTSVLVVEKGRWLLLAEHLGPEAR